MAQRSDSQESLQTEDLPIIGQYNLQRFTQYSPEDAANFYTVKVDDAKRPFAMYPTMGRRHIRIGGSNRLIFNGLSRGLFRSVKYSYTVIGNQIYRIDSNLSTFNISQGRVLSTSGNMYFAYLLVNNIVFACFVDSRAIYVYREDTSQFFVVTDSNGPGTVGGQGPPGFIAAFGNRIVVSIANSSQFFLSSVNLGGNAFDPATCFTTAGASVFAQENGVIGQFAVLQNTLYIFTDFTTGVWSNNPAVFSGTGVTFPWKKNTTYDWNFGIADPLSLDVSFGMMVFMAQNSNGLLQIMASSGGEPERISSKAIDVLFQRYANASDDNGSPFLEGNANGFLYQYENSIFYRLSAGQYQDFGELDEESSANSIEFNFETKTWHRCIELNGERNRIEKHVFYNNYHLVSVQGENTIYEMSGGFYDDEKRNPAQDNPQADDAYIRYPFRYERITPIISEKDYSEFETDYIEIDFVFGESNISYSDNPFLNAQFLIDEVPGSDGNPQYIIAEDSGPDGGPVYIIGEQGNTPSINETTYNALYKPHLELYYSNNGGTTYEPADVREFSQVGVYQWRMRWYQLGCSRNRCYKFIAVSPVPVVILGGTMLRRRVSGGSN